MADNLEHEPVRIEEVGGVVLAILGELPRFMDNSPASVVGNQARSPRIGMSPS